jgi:hypothetical protein
VENGWVAANPLLTPGVTWGGRDDRMRATWLAALHQVARETSATVVGTVQSPEVGRGYYRIQVVLADGRITQFLLQATARLVAVVDITAAAEEIDRGIGPYMLPFLDVPRPDLFDLVGLNVAERDEMERPLTDDQTIALDDYERRNIAFHQPDRVGDVIFNWFD